MCYTWKKKQWGIKHITATWLHTYGLCGVDTVKLSRRQLQSGGVREQKVSEVICENRHFCPAKAAFWGTWQMANTTKTKWKNSYLLLNALQSDVQLCNSRYVRRSFSLKWSALCVCGTLRTAAMATMYLLWQRGRKGGREKKWDKWAVKRRERGSCASWAELNWCFCADWWHLCCLYKYLQNSEQVNFKRAQKPGRGAKGHFTDARRILPHHFSVLYSWDVNPHWDIKIDLAVETTQNSLSIKPTTNANVSAGLDHGYYWNHCDSNVHRCRRS